MRIFNASAAGVVAGVLLFGSVGSVSAIEPFDLDNMSLQLQRDIRSTYIVQFQPSVGRTEVQGRANAIAARFQGQLRHTYTRALSGFAIRMNSTAMARLLDSTDLEIARVSRAVIMTVAQSSDNAAPQAKGGNPGKPDSGGGGGSGGGGSSCDQTVGWNITRVTSMNQGSGSSCPIDANGNGLADYSAAALNPVIAPIVCVLDTGVSFHPDLNVVATRFNVSSNSNTFDDVYGHGTHVAGIIGAKANTEGVVGVAPGVEITSIKVLGDDGFGSDFDVIAGIDLALSEGCNIVNMSLGGSVSVALDTAVVNASAGTTGTSYEDCSVFELDENGAEIPTSPLCLPSVTDASNIIFTLSAGNSAANIADFSPARTSTGPDDNIFTIASFGQERKTKIDEWSAFSNYGDDKDSLIGEVDFALPGGKILSTVPGGYDTFNGTSMAAPHMAGLLVRYIIGSGTTFANNTRTNIGNGVIGTAGVVTRVSGFGPFLSDEEDYIIATDK